VYKKGICAIRDLELFRGRVPNKHISSSLLRPDAPGSENSVHAFEIIVRNLELSSGVCRTTYRRRLQDVDVLAGPHLLECFARQESLEVHDLAASDGLVSSEWARDLFRIFPSCRFTASDLTLYLIEVRRENGESYIFEPDGKPLQYIYPPFVISFNRRDSTVFLANLLLRLRAESGAKSLRSIVSKYHWADFDDPTEYSVPPYRIRLLPLVHPEANAMRRETQQFRIVPHSVLSPLPQPVHVIRTMNIYHHRYFADADLVKGSKAVFDSLVLGGMWIVGRTVEERKPARNEVSILRKIPLGFQVFDRLNGGSELEKSLKNWGLLDGEECSGRRPHDSGKLTSLHK
jgi:hypothetical protein